MMLRSVIQGVGWGGWIRTTTVCINSAASYQLDHAPITKILPRTRKGLREGHEEGDEREKGNFLESADAGADEGVFRSYLPVGGALAG